MRHEECNASASRCVLSAYADDMNPEDRNPYFLSKYFDFASVATQYTQSCHFINYLFLHSLPILSAPFAIQDFGALQLQTVVSLHTLLTPFYPVLQWSEPTQSRFYLGDGSFTAL